MLERNCPYPTKTEQLPARAFSARADGAISEGLNDVFGLHPYLNIRMGRWIPAPAGMTAWMPAPVENTPTKLEHYL